MLSQGVTVVIPTKDRPDLVSITLASVLAQRGVRLRVIVVDDGSCRPSAEWLEGVDERITVLRHDVSLGVSAARNTGLAAVTTEWVAFLDDDDLWAPDKLAHQLAALRDDPACRWACSTEISFYADGRLGRFRYAPSQRDVSTRLLQANDVPGGGSGVLVSTELVQEVGGFRRDLSNLADWDCWIRLSQLSPVARVVRPDVGYRRHAGSMAHAVARSEVELDVLRETYGSLYQRAGVEVDDLRWRGYLNRLTYESGQWRKAVRGSWDMLRTHGRKREVVQPLRYASPGLGRLLQDRALLKRAPEDYAYARGWLGPALAAQPVPPLADRAGAPDAPDVRLSRS